MPSPIAHTAAAYVIYRVARNGTSEKEHAEKWWLSGPFLFTAGLSLLPDFDFLPGLLAGDLDAFHNTFSHSFFSGLVVAVLGAVLLKTLWGGRAIRWFAIILASYELHVVMDYFTDGRGVMLLWPFTAMRFEPPVLLFYGLHRSDGLITIKHVWTVLTEGVFAAAVLLAIRGVVAWMSGNSIENRAISSESPASSSD